MMPPKKAHEGPDVPLTVPSIRQQDIDEVVGVLRSGQLIQGSHVAALERGFEARLGVDHAIAVSNGTATLHLALLALGVGRGDEVVVPAFSFVASANVVELVGARPVFVDVRLADFNIDPGAIDAVITENTRAVLPVHEFGHPADIEAIAAIASRHGLPIIEDAACAFGSTYRNRSVGTFGALGSFSLHPRKAVTSGEGGILITNDPVAADFARTMRNHGISDRFGAPEFVAAGFNYRMTDFQAALVRGQITRMDDMIEARRRVAQRYDQEIAVPWLRKPAKPLKGSTSWQSYHALLECRINRDAVLHLLKSRGIGCSYGAQCIPILPYYAQKYGYRSSDFPSAARAYQQGIVLPMFDTITDEQIDYVVSTINCMDPPAQR